MVSRAAPAAAGCPKTGTTNTGNFACAENHNTAAPGDYSHAENDQTTASGQGAHAEGYQTIASGQNAHAEGVQTTASGNYSHAEGLSGSASGVGAHAEGNGCSAYANGSHAEGGFTTAHGGYSHAEGSGTNTDAAANYAHAEGLYASAIGESAHAEGRKTVATGAQSHASGNQSNAFEDCDYAHAGGAFSPYIIGEAQYRRAQLIGSTPGAAAGESLELRKGQNGSPLFLRNLTAYGVKVRCMVSKDHTAGLSPQFVYFDSDFVAAVDASGAVTLSAVTQCAGPIVGGAAYAGSSLVPSSLGANNLTLKFQIAAGVTTATRATATVEYVELTTVY